jgi:hypothetical protein
MKNENTIYNIIEIICNKYGVNFEELKSPCRKKNLNTPRSIGLALFYSFTLNSKTACASIFNRDHATLIHATKKVMNYYETEKKFKSDLDAILSELNYKLATNYTYQHIVDAHDGYKTYKDSKMDYYQEFQIKARELMEVNNPDLILILVDEMKQIYSKI